MYNHYVFALMLISAVISALLEVVEQLCVSSLMTTGVSGENARGILDYGTLRI